jgi:hypothetical protein
VPARPPPEADHVFLFQNREHMSPCPSSNGLESCTRRAPAWARGVSNRLRRPCFLAALVVVAAVAGSPLTAQTEGDYLYRVTMIRAAPGGFVQLMEALEAARSLDEEAGDMAPFSIRHSQGDQWDFMLLYPLESFDTYHSTERTDTRTAVWESDRGRTISATLEQFTAFQEEWFANSAPVEEMARRFEGMGMFHVEMFAGLPGQRDQLIEQRRMENRYYDQLGRQLNMLFVREAGPNWDAMTIGFHESLLTFAEAGERFSVAQQDEAARAAGFDGVGAISPYLRSLLSYHRDTIGVRMR